MAASPPHHALRPAAAVLAWLWPGLGHIHNGAPRRGWLIMAGVLFLFVGGLLVGGLDCVDRKNDPLWFLAQSICGPLAIAADLADQGLVQRRQISSEQWRRDLAVRQRYLDGDSRIIESLRRVGLGRVNEMGTLYTALAGLMNLVVILDALAPRGGGDLGRRDPGSDS